MTLIPTSVIGTVSPILAEGYTHSQLNDMFMAAGFPGDAPEGNKSDKVRAWLRRANEECDEPLALFGQVIAEFMDVESHPAYIEQQGGDPRDKIHAALAKEGLSYQRGGNILGAALSGPSNFSIADGIAALRTHAGSAHCHSFGRSYRLAPRHARLAVHAAHTMTLFLFETWENQGRRS
jgi:hypothetical protein